MNGDRYLIVNADDFGISAGVNAGIIRGHEQGIVTSTSLMTRWPAARAAADYARANPGLGVGLHIDLGEWIHRDGQWQVLYHVVDLKDSFAVHDEVRRQLDAFRNLVGRDPDHIDSHQHVHRAGCAQAACMEIAHELRVPLRHFCKVRFCGDFYGQDARGEPYPQQIGVKALCGMIGNLSPGASEICCHPAIGADLETMYVGEREIELGALCDPQTRAAVEHSKVILCTFGGIGPSAMG